MKTLKITIDKKEYEIKVKEEDVKVLLKILNVFNEDKLVTEGNNWVLLKQ